MNLLNLSWVQVQEYLATNDQLIIPAGTCEQQLLNIKSRIA